MDLTILYRGPLSSCNYGCDYCPFAKHHETRQELDVDERALARFLDWAAAQGGRGHTLAIQFTPWGEALVRPWYQESLVRLTNFPHVRLATIQTNLSCRLDWAGRCDKSKLALWCTYHPTETTRERFLAKCRELDRRAVRYSVGIVGLKEHLAEAEALRRDLDAGVYLWVNAYKRRGGYYGDDDVSRLAAIDPLFPLNNTRHPTLGLDCEAGHTVFSVDGDGAMRRCHFIKSPIGTIYEDDWEHALRPTPCTNATCGCHIGYAHVPSLRLDEAFGHDGVLSRIPLTMPPRLPLPVIA